MQVSAEVTGPLEVGLQATSSGCGESCPGASSPAPALSFAKTAGSSL